MPTMTDVRVGPIPGAGEHGNRSAGHVNVSRMIPPAEASAVTDLNEGTATPAVERDVSSRADSNSSSRIAIGAEAAIANLHPTSEDAAIQSDRSGSAQGDRAAVNAGRRFPAMSELSVR